MFVGKLEIAAPPSLASAGQVLRLASYLYLQVFVFQMATPIRDVHYSAVRTGTEVPFLVFFAALFSFSDSAREVIRVPEWPTAPRQQILLLPAVVHSLLSI